MVESEEIVSALEGVLKNDLKGFAIVVTAGWTVERIDSVRAVTNLSTEKMGCAIAEAAARRGAEVVLIAAKTVSVPPVVARVVRVESAREMEKAVLKEFPKADAFIMAAAVADFSPKEFEGKLESGRETLLRLYPNPYILAGAGRIKKPGQVLAGFALEARDLVKGARKKLVEKNLDFIVANSPGAIGAEDAEVVVVKKKLGAAPAENAQNPVR